MQTTKIIEEEISDLKVSSLPTRPNATPKYGGYSYSAAEMKAAFDKLPLFIAEKFNSLIDDIEAESSGISEAMKTGISEGHTLKNLFEDIENGAFAVYLILNGKPLAEHIEEILTRLEQLEERTGL